LRRYIAGLPKQTPRSTEQRYNSLWSARIIRTNDATNFFCVEQADASPAETKVLIDSEERDCGCYCTAILAFSITLPQSAASSAKKRAASGRVEPTASIFISARRLRTSGRRKISATSRLMRSASASGVPGGATMPNQVIEW